MSDVRKLGTVHGKRGRDTRSVRKSKSSQRGIDVDRFSLGVWEKSKGEDGAPKMSLDTSRKISIITNKTLIGLLELTFRAFLLR